MDYKKEIDNIVDKALTEKTFTLEIIDEIKQLKELPQKLDEASEQIDILIDEKSILAEELGKYKELDSKVRELSEVLTKKEKELELKEVEFKWKDHLLTKYESMMSLVFRNQTIRENTFGSTPVTDNNGYCYQQSTSNNKETTIE